MSDPVRFVIVGMQRSGTSVTQQCVAGHPEVSCPEDEVRVEPFFTRGLAVYTVRGRESFARRTAGHRRLFDAITRPARPGAERALGLKVAVASYAQALDLYIGLVEHFPDVRIVLVERRDLLAQHASLLLARESGRWHRHGLREARSDARIRPDPEVFGRYAAEACRIHRLLGDLAGSHALLRIGYEADIEPGFDPRALFDFLGLRPLEPTWLRMRKISPPLEDFVDGLDALRRIEAQARAEPQADPMPDLLARIAEQDRSEDPHLLVHRVQARLERGFTAAAACDLRVLAERADELEASLAGRASGYAVHLGVDDAAWRTRWPGDGIFLVSRAAALSTVGRDDLALDALVEAMPDAGAVERGSWREVAEGAVAGLAARGGLPVWLRRAEGARAGAAAVFELLDARRIGDRAAGRDAAQRLLEVAPDLLARLALDEPADRA
jgi:hypothetical protein